ncbi:MAG: hypothetical protein H6737_00395 [Alphaproteobacteria bacterium]|nr:hypothetical protein [Alphaproteobacteria bacterium]
MSEVLAAGGSWAVIVLGLGGLGALISLALAGLAFTKRRVPLALFAALPILVCIVGAIGAWSGAGTVFGALESADADHVNDIAMAGLWTSVTVDWFSRWVAAFLLVLCSWCAGVGATIAVGPAEESRLTPFAAAFAGLTSLVGAIGLAAYGLGKGLALEAQLLAAVILLGGLGVAFSSTRRALYEHTNRVAGMRFTSAACFVLAVMYGGRAVSMGTQIAMFGPNGQANGLDLPSAVVMWTDVADPVWTVAWVSFALALLIAFFGFFSELGEIVQRFTLVDVWATLALVACLATVRVVEESRTNALLDVGTHAPARMIFDQWGNDLASGALTIEKQPISASPKKGGYGDVLVFHDFVVGYDAETGNPITKREWRRTWVWDGSSWYADDSPLDCEGHPQPCSPPTIGTQRIPLIAIGKGEDATNLLSVAKTLPGGEFMLLLRALDVGAEQLVPSQLAHKQLGFLPIKVEHTIDLTKDLWVDAGYKEMFWGPVFWFGEGEDKEPLFYTDAIFAETGAEGAHVLVSEKARVEGVAGSCLAIQNSHDDGKAVPNDKWCSIVAGDVEEWRANARNEWDLPKEDRWLRIRTETPKPNMIAEGEPEIDVAKIEDIFRRETGAIAWCQLQAHEKALDEYDPDDKEAELTETWGKMDLSVVINDRGRINGTYVEDASKLKNSEISRCAAGRYRKLAFDELPKPAPVPEGEERPEPLAVTVYLTYTFPKLPTDDEGWETFKEEFAEARKNLSARAE